MFVMRTTQILFLSGVLSACGTDVTGPQSRADHQQLLVNSSTVYWAGIALYQASTGNPNIATATPRGTGGGATVTCVSVGSTSVQGIIRENNNGVWSFTYLSGSVTCDDQGGGGGIIA
jgi:hypothetical protein